MSKRTLGNYFKVPQRKPFADKERLLDGSTGFVDYYPVALTAEETEELRKFADEWHDWHVDHVVIYGKHMKCPRKVTAFGSPGLVYRYSGTETKSPPEGWGCDVMRTVVERIREKLGVVVNFCHANRYADGKDMIGWHADDETDLAPGSPIVCLSLGATRDFQVRPKLGGKICLTQKLASGSIIVMGGALQQHYKHCVPRRAGVGDVRYSFTFRCVRAGVGEEN